jgi:phosphoribosylformylglycinamidine synthase I
MNRENISVLVLSGDGINCENETSLAFKELKASTKIIHIQDLIENPNELLKHHILALPGGFSFGDEIGSGQILSLKLKYSLGKELQKFIDSGKLIIGICNGFQALVRLGLLPKPLEERTMTLTHNRQGHFIDRWVECKIPTSNCIWTKSFQGKVISLPIRHGEGKIVFKGDKDEQASHFETLLNNGQIALSYCDDVNGSYAQIAGVTDPTGKILGLMPHPEAAISKWLSPDGKQKSSEIGDGLYFFENALNYCEENLI